MKPRANRRWIFAFLLLVPSVSGLAGGDVCRDDIPVTVTVTRARAVDDPEGLGAGDPELYVIVRFRNDADDSLINECVLGPNGSSRNLNGPLTCQVMIPAPYDPLDLEIELWDQDGEIFGGDDTHLDLAPGGGCNLDFDFDPKCNRVFDDENAGDIPGCPVGGGAGINCTGDERTITGDGEECFDGDGGAYRGRITFSVLIGDGLPALDDDLAASQLEVIQTTPNPDAIVDKKPTMVRFTVGNTYDVLQSPVVRVEAVDELGNLFVHQRTVDVESCTKTVVEMYGPGWDGGGNWGFLPVADPAADPAGVLVVTARVDPDHLIDDDNADCRQTNNLLQNKRIPIKNMQRLDVMLQPLSTGECAAEDGDSTDVDDTAPAAEPLLLDLYPVRIAIAHTEGEVLDALNPLHDPELLLDTLDLMAALLIEDGIDRLVLVVKDGWFECNSFDGDLQPAIGLSLGDDTRIVLVERPDGTTDAEVVSHEVGHTYGLSEAPCNLGLLTGQCEDEYNFCPGAGPPCNGSGLGTRGFRLSDGIPMDGMTCIMGSSSSGAPDAWIDDGDYNHLIQRLKDDPDPEVLWVRVHLGKGGVGTFFKDDASRLTGVPDYPAASAGGPAPGGETTSLVFQDGFGMTLDTVSFTRETADTDGDGYVDSFGLPEKPGPVEAVDLPLLVALPAGTASIYLVRLQPDPRTGEPVPAVTDTLVVPAEAVDIEIAHPPSSVLVSPGDEVPIHWRELTQPPLGPRLSYVFVSRDNGASWIPISGRIPGHDYTWKPRIEGRYLVRVFSTNGFNTDDARSESDLDGDGCGDSVDFFPTVPDVDQDGDGIAEICDNCPEGAQNPFQQDADQDSRGDACDLCPLVADPDQYDQDSDGHGDACDCAADNPGAWELPAEVTGLMVHRSTLGPDHVRLTWDPVAAQAGPGSACDLLTGQLSDLRADAGFLGTECLDGDVYATEIDKVQRQPEPPLPNGYWYLVRGQNACGWGTWGDGTLVPDPRDFLEPVNCFPSDLP